MSDDDKPSRTRTRARSGGNGPSRAEQDGAKQDGAKQDRSGGKGGSGSGDGDAGRGDPGRGGGPDGSGSGSESSGQGGRGNRNRRRNKRRRGGRKRGGNKPEPQSEGVGFWGDVDKLPAPQNQVRMTDDPGAVPRSLGTPPLPGHEHIAQHYFELVYDRAVTTASALAAAGGLIEPDELTELTEPTDGDSDDDEG